MGTTFSAIPHEGTYILYCDKHGEIPNCRDLKCFACFNEKYIFRTSSLLEKIIPPTVTGNWQGTWMINCQKHGININSVSCCIECSKTKLPVSI